MRFSGNDYDEEVIFNLKTNTVSQIETSSEESEESKDSGHMTRQNIPAYGSSNEEQSENSPSLREQESAKNSEKEESNEKIIYRCL